MKKSIATLLGVGIVAVALALTPVALAQAVLTDQQPDADKEVVVLAQSSAINSDAGSNPSQMTASESALPFSGLDIGYLLGGSLIVLLTAALLARPLPVTRRRP